jgi:hypothetical protein
VSDGEAKAAVRLEPGVAAVHRATHVETNLEAVPVAADGSFAATFARQQLQTYRVEFVPATAK